MARPLQVSPVAGLRKLVGFVQLSRARFFKIVPALSSFCAQYGEGAGQSGESSHDSEETSLAKPRKPSSYRVNWQGGAQRDAAAAATETAAHR